MEGVFMLEIQSRFTTERVPELSLSDFLFGSSLAKANFVADLFKGLKHFGFIILKDHPIDTDLLDHAYSLSEQLFALPESRKLEMISPLGAGQRGYTPFGQEHAKDSKYPDLKEFWHIGRNQNLWPSEFSDFERTFSKLFAMLDAVGRTLLQALTTPLGVSEDFFATRVDRGQSILRLLHYPPIPAGVDPQCLRAAPHEDINLITILVAASTSGLELKDRNGHWLPVETDRNNLIVDSGDMLARITNDIIPATTHRVVNPRGPNTSRYSMPFFMHPNPDAVLSCLPSCRSGGAKYLDITADEFLHQRLREIGLKSEGK